VGIPFSWVADRSGTAGTEDAVSYPKREDLSWTA
jgi:hypothetical protein